MKLLIITNLFPNSTEPNRGIFNKQQFVALSKLCELRVVAPLPWGGVSAPKEETIDGIKTYHPRYVVIPKIGRPWLGQSFYHGIKNTVASILKEFNCDAILATWAYPDGYAASLLSKEINKPLIIKVHGTDINLGLNVGWRRNKVSEALRSARHTIAVSHGLKEKMIGLGVADEKIALIPNGVDRNIFYPKDKKECRKQLGIAQNIKYVLFIGNLVELKGVNFLIDAMKALPEDVHLNLVGDGEMKVSLQHFAEKFGINKRVHFIGRIPHKDIPVWINASDVLCLPSLHEGCPNVVLESLACGVPVVGTNVGGIPDIIDTPEKGIVVDSQSPAKLADAIKNIMDHPQNFIVRSQQISSWEETAEKIFNIIKKVTN